MKGPGRTLEVRHRHLHSVAVLALLRTAQPAVQRPHVVQDRRQLVADVRHRVVRAGVDVSPRELEGTLRAHLESTLQKTQLAEIFFEGGHSVYTLGDSYTRSSPEGDVKNVR